MADITFACGQSGVLTYTRQIEVIGNNVANLQTTSFKASDVNFAELAYELILLPGKAGNTRGSPPLGTQYGFGVQVGTILPNFIQGPAVNGLNFDVFLDGPQGTISPSFFRVVDSSGNVFYTRNGAFQPKAGGASGPVNLQLPRGPVVLTNFVDGQNVPIVLPGGTDFPGQPTITPTGEIVEGNPTGLRVQLVRFQNPEGLLQDGETLYRETQFSGPPVIGFPGDPGFAVTIDGFLEGSNTELAQQLVLLLGAAAAVNFNAQSIQAANQEILTTLRLTGLI